MGMSWDKNKLRNAVAATVVATGLAACGGSDGGSGGGNPAHRDLQNGLANLNVSRDDMSGLWVIYSDRSGSETGSDRSAGNNLHETEREEWEESSEMIVRGVLQIQDEGDGRLRVGRCAGSTTDDDAEGNHWQYVYVNDGIFEVDDFDYGYYYDSRDYYDDYNHISLFRFEEVEIIDNISMRGIERYTVTHEDSASSVNRSASGEIFLNKVRDNGEDPIGTITLNDEKSAVRCLSYFKGSQSGSFSGSTTSSEVANTSVESEGQFEAESLALYEDLQAIYSYDNRLLYSKETTKSDRTSVVEAFEGEDESTNEVKVDGYNEYLNVRVSNEESAYHENSTIVEDGDDARTEFKFSLDVNTGLTYQGSFSEVDVRGNVDAEDLDSGSFEVDITKTFDVPSNGDDQAAQ